MEKSFIHIAAGEITDNMFNIIGSDWMLITAKNKEGEVNTMTASWGMAGIIWNRPVAACFVRPQRHTHSFIGEAEYYTLSFFEKEYKDALRLCGGKSGRDTDKFSSTGLRPFVLGCDAVGIEQARMILICKKLYSDNLKGENFISADITDKFYPAHDHHTYYIGEITDVLVKKQ